MAVVGVTDQAADAGTPPLIIDLLQWLAPHDDESPYRHLYHYGIARIALTSSDLDADVARLKAAPGRRRRALCISTV